MTLIKGETPYLAMKHCHHEERCEGPDGSCLRVRCFHSNAGDHVAYNQGRDTWSHQETVIGQAPPICCAPITPDITPEQQAAYDSAPLLDLPASELEVIDILVIGERAAIEARVGNSGADSYFEMRQRAFNSAWSKAGFPPKARLVGRVLIDIDRSFNRTYSQFLTQFRKGEQEFADVPAMLEHYGCDIAMLYIDNTGVGGVGYVRVVEGTEWGKDWAFNIVDPDSAVLRHSDIHECGHNMGLSHHRSQGGGGLYSFSFGGADPTRTYGTIQTYTSVAPNRLQQISDGGVALAPNGLPLSEPDANALLSHTTALNSIAGTRLRRDENHGVPVPGPGPVEPPPPPPPALTEIQVLVPEHINVQESYAAQGIARKFAFKVWAAPSDGVVTVRVKDWGEVEKWRYQWGAGFTGRVSDAGDEDYEIIKGTSHVFTPSFIVLRTPTIEPPQTMVFEVEGFAKDASWHFRREVRVTINDPLYVPGGTPNRPPVITPIPDIEVQAGTVFEVPVEVYDPDGDEVVLTVDEIPGWAEVQGSVVVLSPPDIPGVTGVESVITVYARDGNDGHLGVEQFAVTVTAPPPQWLPYTGEVLEETPGERFRIEGDNYIPE